MGQSGGGKHALRGRARFGSSDSSGGDGGVLDAELAAESAPVALESMAAPADLLCDDVHVLHMGVRRVFGSVVGGDLVAPPVNCSRKAMISEISTSVQ